MYNNRLVHVCMYKLLQLPRSCTKLHLVVASLPIMADKILARIPKIRGCPYKHLILLSHCCRYEQQKQAYDAGYSAGYLHQELSPNGMGEAGGSGATINTPPPLLSPRHRRRKKNPDMPRRNM